MIRTSYKFLIVLAIMFLILGLAACSTDQTATPTPTPTPTSTPDPTPAPVPTKTPAWMEIELTDVTTGKNFKISDFKGKTILMESFAVWCPTCLAQQKQMQKLGQGEDENIIHISLDTDPNEDEERVREHQQRNGFDWYFVVSPVELTEALIDEFGLTIVSAPRAPVLLICEDQSARFLRSGVKSAEELILEIEKGCQ